MTLVSNRLAPLLFVMPAIAFYLWFGHSVAQPLWADEVITTELIKSASFAHMFSAIKTGLDSTPPLYTGFGWLVLNYVVPEVAPELLLRVTNIIIVAAIIWISYLSLRQFFDRVTSTIVSIIFIYLCKWQLEYLTLEVRAYAALVLATAASIYFSFLTHRRPSHLLFICASASYCALVLTHLFGFIYFVCISACSIIAALIESDRKSVRKTILASIPAMVLFIAWLPIVRNQAQLGNWIPRPSIRSLLDSSYLTCLIREGDDFGLVDVV
jgi:hypothetical protein